MTRLIRYEYAWKTMVLLALGFAVGSTAHDWYRGAETSLGTIALWCAIKFFAWGIPMAIFELMRLNNTNRKPLTFPRNETGEVEGSATLARLGWVPTPGWFILSDDHLKFFSRTRKKDISLPLSEIANVNRSVLPYALKFQLEDGSKFSFTVGDRERWLEEIDHARSRKN